MSNAEDHGGEECIGTWVRNVEQLERQAKNDTCWPEFGGAHACCCFYIEKNGWPKGISKKRRKVKSIDNTEMQED